MAETRAGPKCIVFPLEGRSCHLMVYGVPDRLINARLKRRDVILILLHGFWLLMVVIDA